MLGKDGLFVRDGVDGADGVDDRSKTSLSTSLISKFISSSFTCILSLN
ncbi:23203_t:CDS:1 [Gigaspora rosea]|nr:23203_t:CDS:1 [Gigaspora rosea]